MLSFSFPSDLVEAARAGQQLCSRVQVKAELIYAVRVNLDFSYVMFNILDMGGCRRKGLWWDNQFYTLANGNMLNG